jgi:hypothetical protein|nr:MAG TPA: hypothetical protein [Caudoviricetes sp.]
MDDCNIIIITTILIVVLALFLVFLTLVKKSMIILRSATKMVVENLDSYSFICEDEDVITMTFAIVRVNLWKKNKRVSIHRINSSFCYYPRKINNLLIWFPMTKNLEKYLYDALIEYDYRKRREIRLMNEFKENNKDVFRK